MSDAISLGQSIIQANRFLMEIHKDLYLMVVALDKAMYENGWYPTRNNRISADVSCNLAPDKWLLRHIWRLYVPDAARIKTSIVASVLINLEPADVYDEPICFLAAASFPSATSCKDIWNAWKDHEPTSEFLAGKEDFQTLDSNSQLREIFPKAVDGRANVVKLCRVTDVQSIRDKIVDPLLKAAKELTQ